MNQKLKIKIGFILAKSRVCAWIASCIDASEKEEMRQTMIKIWGYDVFEKEVLTSSDLTKG